MRETEINFTLGFEEIASYKDDRNDVRRTFLNCYIKGNTALPVY